MFYPVDIQCVKYRVVEWWNLFFKNYFYVNYSRKYVKKCEKPSREGWGMAVIALQKHSYCSAKA